MTLSSSLLLSPLGLTLPSQNPITHSVKVKGHGITI